MSGSLVLLTIWGTEEGWGPGSPPPPGQALPQAPSVSSGRRRKLPEAPSSAGVPLGITHKSRSVPSRGSSATPAPISPSFKSSPFTFQWRCVHVGDSPTSLWRGVCPPHTPWSMPRGPSPLLLSSGLCSFEHGSTRGLRLRTHRSEGLEVAATREAPQGLPTAASSRRAGQGAERRRSPRLPRRTSLTEREMKSAVRRKSSL